MNRGFWSNLPRPVIGLSPMDGVSDAAFRAITERYGRPDILFTEFTAVEAIARGKTKVMEALITKPSSSPTVAQIFGTEVQSYYSSALAIAEMGFAGIDINMGCPAKNIQQRGAGAGLIRTPKLAQKIVRTVQKAMQDRADGITMEQAGVHPDVIGFVSWYRTRFGATPLEGVLPVSVKTRIGFDVPAVESWIPALLEVAPVNITLHGRTLKQMYTGMADWDEIAKAAEIVHASGSGITLLGNGDVQSRDDALERVATYKVDGVLIGRASFGNPWLFAGREPTPRERILVALEHTRTFMELTPEAHFLSMRKHLAWYCKGFPNAADFRLKFVRANSEEEVKNIAAEAMEMLAQGTHT
ncbi:MAG: tRNA-dihydrouridine synthase [Patescibacteria group bacterium]|nr:tRNA-dihydrouridine synthase [Patescibacteria group bacterium]